MKPKDTDAVIGGLSSGLTSAAVLGFGVDPQKMSDEQLARLHRSIEKELKRRGLPIPISEEEELATKKMDADHQLWLQREKEKRDAYNKKEREDSAAIAQAIRDWGYTGQFKLIIDTNGRKKLRVAYFKTAHTFGSVHLYLKGKPPTAEPFGGGGLDDWFDGKGAKIKNLLAAIAKNDDTYVTACNTDIKEGVIPTPELLKLCRQALGLAS